jgi:hypothetical protein
MDKDNIIKLLQDEILSLKNENALLKEQLNKYLLKNKNYYENNKEEHKKRVREYQIKNNYKSTYVPSPEKKKEYARRAYLKKKEKLQKEQEKIDENI